MENSKVICCAELLKKTSRTIDVIKEFMKKIKLVVELRSMNLLDCVEMDHSEKHLSSVLKNRFECCIRILMNQINDINQLILKINAIETDTCISQNIFVTREDLRNFLVCEFKVATIRGIPLKNVKFADRFFLGRDDVFQKDLDRIVEIMNERSSASDAKLLYFYDFSYDDSYFLDSDDPLCGQKMCVHLLRAEYFISCMTRLGFCMFNNSIKRTLKALKVNYEEKIGRTCTSSEIHNPSSDLHGQDSECSKISLLQVDISPQKST